MPKKNTNIHPYIYSTGVPFIISAPSGAGKTTLIKKLRKEFPDITYSISCTTRPPRNNEQDGKDYYFLSKEDFIRKRNNNEFAEYAHVHDHFYGTPIEPIIALLNAGKDILFDIDVQGAAQLRLNIPYSKYIFILPPTINDLKKRLQTRKTDTDETIKKRLSAAIREIKEAHWFNAWIINDNIDKAYDELRAMYISSKLNPMHQQNLINTLIKDWY